jgi:uncharacterized delta-60 repeat protein
MLAAGDLDLTFNPSGANTGIPGTNMISIVPNRNDYGNAMRVQPWDNKVVVAGDTTLASGDQISLARFNTDGSIDTAFGTGGFTSIRAGEYVDKINGVDFQTVGGGNRIVVAGYTWVSGADLVFFTEEGRNIVYSPLRDFRPQDVGFDLEITGGTGWTSGTYTISELIDVPNFGVGAVLSSNPAPVTDGAILAGGEWTLNNYDFLVMRFLENGQLDTSFAKDGYAIYPVETTNDFGFNVRVQPWDQKIVVAGYDLFQGEYDFAVMRLNPDGELDDSFFAFLPGDSTAKFQPGTTSINFSGNDYANTLDFYNDGTQRILVGGSAGTVNSNLAFARLLPTGVLDTTFGTDGKANISLPNNRTEYVNSLKVYQSGPNAGKIIATGTYFISSSNYEPFVARLTSAGALDSTFGSNGTVVLDLGSGKDYGNGVDVQSDNKVVIAGTNTFGTGTSAYVSRFNDNGTADNTFLGTTNFSRITFDGSTTYGAAIEIVRDGALSGRIVVGGATLNEQTTPNNLDFMAFRLEGDAPGQKPVLNVESRETTEGDASVKNQMFGFRLSAPSTVPITINYQTVDGTAKAGIDYRGKSGSVTFQPGETIKNVPFSIIGNTDYQATRVMTIAITSTGATVAGNATLTIRDDDGTWQNVNTPTDATADGQVNSSDLLALIDSINRTGVLSFTRALTTPQTYYDVNGDTFFTPTDILMVIDDLNRRAFVGSGTNSSVEFNGSTSEIAPSGTTLAAELQTLAIEPKLVPYDVSWSWSNETAGVPAAYSTQSATTVGDNRTVVPVGATNPAELPQSANISPQAWQAYFEQLGTEDEEEDDDHSLELFDLFA